MISNRPYLLRAFYQWIEDSSCTPILVIDANHPRCKIPQDYVEGGEIIFNISSTAVRDLKLLNDTVEFKASFSGVIHIIAVPIKAVLAIYAEENGEGIFFDADELSDDDDSEQESLVLREIKKTAEGNIDSDNNIEIGDPQKRAKPFLKLVE